MNSSLRTREDILQAYERNKDVVYQVCCFRLSRSSSDIMDAFQQTFLKLILRKQPFENEEHEKAWLILAATNVCKDMLKSAWKRNLTMDYEPYPDLAFPIEIDEITTYITALPEKYQTAVYLYYYKGYSAKEIGKLTGKAESTIWGHLHKARKLLKAIITEEEQ